MSWTIVVDPETLAFQGQYLTANPPLMNWPGVQCTCEDPTVVMAVQDPTSNVITLQTDPAKVQAKTQAQWVSVRAQQSDLLYKSDWTCSVVDPPAPILAQRDQWIAYRQALRDVTKQSDPFNIEWPTSP